MKGFQRALTRCLAAVILLQAFCAGALAGRAADTDVPTYEQYLAEQYLTAKHFDYYFHDFQEPYRAIVEFKEQDLTYQGLLTAWEFATFELSDLMEYSSKQKGFYMAILFDILHEGITTQNLFKDLAKESDTTWASVAKKVLALGVDLNGKVDTGSELFAKVTDTIDCAELAGVFDIIGDVGQYAESFFDYADMLSKLVRIKSVSAASKELSDLFDKVMSYSDDPAMDAALADMKLLCANTLTGDLAKGIIAGEELNATAAELVLDKVWESLLTQLGTYGIAVQAGQAMGKAATNWLFSTEAEFELYYSMRALYHFEDALKQAIDSYRSSYSYSKTHDNARRFKISVDMLWRTYQLALEYGRQYNEHIYVDGVVNALRFWFREEQYNEYIHHVNILEKQLEAQMSYASTYAYNDYLELYYSDELTLSGYPVQKEEETMTAAEAEAVFEELRIASFAISNQYITEATTLTADVETLGSLFVSADLDLAGHTFLVGGDAVQSGYSLINLNGGTLHVRGNMRQTEGTINLNNGTLNIGGWFKQQQETVNNVGETVYSEVYAALDMVNANDNMHVAGDFVIHALADGYNYNDFTAGTLTIGGNVSTYSQFAASGTHKTILNGTGAQTVFCENSSICFNQLETAGNEAQSIIWSGYLDIQTLASDMDLTAENLILYNIDLNQKTMDIVGDIIVEGSSAIGKTVDLNGGRLNVHGNLRQTEGTINLNNGTLNIDGWFKQQQETVNNIGETVYSEVYAALDMLNPGDKMHVGGDFVIHALWDGYNYNDFTAGTLTIGGNVSAYSQFAASGTHKTILNGTGAQTVFCENSGICFNQLETTGNEAQSIIWSGYLDIQTLASDMDLTAENLILYNIDLNQKSMDIAGDVTVEGSSAIGKTVDLNGGTLHVHGNMRQTKGTINLNNGTLNIDGWFKQQQETVNNIGETVYSEVYAALDMLNPGDKMHVGGDFVIHALWDGYNYNDFTAGTLTIGGNVTVFSRFAASGTHKTILNGTGMQTVTFKDYPSSKLNILQLTKARSSYVFSPEPCWTTLEEPAMLELSGAAIDSSSGTPVVSVQLTSIAPVSGQCVAALYDNGRMVYCAFLGIESAISQQIRIETGYAGKYTDYKIMFLEKETYRPLCDAQAGSPEG